MTTVTTSKISIYLINNIFDSVIKILIKYQLKKKQPTTTMKETGEEENKKIIEGEKSPECSST